MKLNQHKLRKWRRLLLLRELRTDDEGNRESFCPMCNRAMATWQAQAHHIFPKSLYPQQAYDLENGIVLCLGCHMGIVHGGNSFRDLSTEHHWRFFIRAFDDYVETQYEYNKENQGRI